MDIVTPVLPLEHATAQTFDIDLDARMLARLWGHIDMAGECWQWTSKATHQGYGIFYATRAVRAHRLVYDILAGPIPDGLHLDHLCRNRGCVNPAHMEPVTNEENIRRGYAARRAERGDA